MSNSCKLCELKVLVKNMVFIPCKNLTTGDNFSEFKCTEKFWQRILLTLVENKFQGGTFMLTIDKNVLEFKIL